MRNKFVVKLSQNSCSNSISGNNNGYE